MKSQNEIEFGRYRMPYSRMPYGRTRAEKKIQMSNVCRLCDAMRTAKAEEEFKIELFIEFVHVFVVRQ